MCTYKKYTKDVRTCICLLVPTHACKFIKRIQRVDDVTNIPPDTKTPSPLTLTALMIELWPMRFYRAGLIRKYNAADL